MATAGVKLSSAKPEQAPRQQTIVVLIESYLPILGGAQNNVHELCRRLSRRDFKCEILTRRYAARHERVETVDGVTIRRFGLFPIRPLAKLFWAVAVTSYLVRRRKLYDLVLSVPIFYWPDLLPAYLNRLITGKPFLVRTTLAGNFDSMLSWSIRSVGDFTKRLLFPPPLWRKVLSAAAAIVAQSEFLLERARFFGLNRCKLISNGVDTARFRVAGDEQKRTLRRQLELPEKAVIVVCTARFVVEKNQIVLLRAIQSLVAQPESPRVLLLLLGIEEFNQGKANEEQLRHFVESNGLGPHVRFLRDVLNVEEYLQAADIFVLPTKFDEGLSNSVLEAMSCGLPVVCSDLPQLEAMFPAGTGFFFPPDDVEALTDHLRHLIARPGDTSDLGRTLAEHMRTTQPIEGSIDAYESLISASSGRNNP